MVDSDVSVISDEENTVLTLIFCSLKHVYLYQNGTHLFAIGNSNIRVEFPAFIKMMKKSSAADPHNMHLLFDYRDTGNTSAHAPEIFTSNKSA